MSEKFPPFQSPANREAMQRILAMADTIPGDARDTFLNGCGAAMQGQSGLENAKPIDTETEHPIWQVGYELTLSQIASAGLANTTNSRRNS